MDVEEVFSFLSWTQLLVSLSLAFYTLQYYELVKNLWLIPHHLNSASCLDMSSNSESSDNYDFIGDNCTDYRKFI